ncbi:hypothetical protein HII31_00289 [Pseudocercospora fuligena]|uniref:Uncharacterized protein n=1 Tax=Pseudocercospora fuligena TaxID=685502 RepID=A0A8H6VNP2_9PEZI|nr:hypothetical protein HII31_00289 [Pseudocercospora fuligena]
MYKFTNFLQERSQIRSLKNGSLTSSVPFSKLLKIFIRHESQPYTTRRAQANDRSFFGAWQRNWLRVMAMDFRQFVHFCHNPNHRQYRGRCELVIELFPTADFSNPPQEMSRTTLFNPPLTIGERVLLATRRQWASPGLILEASKHLDLRVYQGLAKLWLHFIQSLGQNPGQGPRLPHDVRRIWVISKDNDKPNSACGPHQLHGSALGDIARELRNQIGTGHVNVVF